MARAWRAVEHAFGRVAPRDVAGVVAVGRARDVRRPTLISGRRAQQYDAIFGLPAL